MELNHVKRLIRSLCEPLHHRTTGVVVFSRNGRSRTDTVLLPKQVGLPLSNTPMFPLLSSSYGNRTRLSGLKGQYPEPIDERAVTITSGLGGARTLVSWSSAKRYTVSATSPFLFRRSRPTRVPSTSPVTTRNRSYKTKKARRLATPGLCRLSTAETVGRHKRRRSEGFTPPDWNRGAKPSLAIRSDLIRCRVMCNAVFTIKVCSHLAKRSPWWGCNSLDADHRGVVRKFFEKIFRARIVPPNLVQKTGLLGPLAVHFRDSYDKT